MISIKENIRSKEIKEALVRYAPLAKEGECCSKCNMEKVIPVRLNLYRGDC